MCDNFLNLVELDNVLLSECNYFDLDEKTKRVIDTTAFTIAHFNVHSIPNKYNDLLELLNALNEKGMLPDVLLLCETFLSEKNASKFSFDNYEMVNMFRKTKSRGGVSVLLKSNIRFTERPDLSLFEEGKFESVFVELHRTGRCNVIIGEVYRVPGTSEDDFLKNYEQIVTTVRSERKQIVVGTDQNLDLLKINQHGNTMKFFELNMNNNLLPTIYKPTRVTHSSATLIDNIYVDCELYKAMKSFIIRTDISDHFMCLTSIQDSLTPIRNKQCRRVRKITDSVLRNMNASLSYRDWNVLEAMGVDEGCEYLIQEIQSVMDFYAPEKLVTINNDKFKRDEPWMTKGLRISSRRCWQLYKKVYKKSRDGEEYQNYKTYRNAYNSIRRKAKITYYHEIIHQCKNDTKKLWAILRKVTGKLSNKNNLSDEIIVNGIKETNKLKISNGFAKHYSQIGNILANRIMEKGNCRDPLGYMKNKVDQNCFLFPTDHLEVARLATALKMKDSQGYDQISNRILKKILPSIVDALVIIFNKSLLEGLFPKNMKMAIVKPLYKSKNRTEINNYRPVSLLPTISKLLEKIVHIRIMKFLKRNEVLYEGQYGFRKGRSTHDAILDFTGNVLDRLDRGDYTIGLFLDMSKAFDTLKHDTLLRKFEFYGIRGVALNWIKSYLQLRSIKVNFNGTISDEFEVSYGTPQGSVLGPLMYVVLANDLVKTLKFSNCVTFADDTTLIASGRNLKFLYRKVNEDLRTLSSWFDSNSLTLNVEKSKYILFRSKKKLPNYIGSLKLSGKNICRVKDIKFLGVIVDEFLEWNMQVKSVCTKVISGNYSLRMTKKLLPLKSKLLVYHANIQSHLNYAISSWGPMIKEKDLKQLRKQQNIAIRSIFNIGSRASLSPYYKQASILKIDDLIKLSLLKVSFRYVNGILPKRISNLFDLTEHEYETRNKHNIRAAPHTSHIYNKSFLGKSPNLWLNLQNKIKSENKVKRFAKCFTKEVLKLY